MGLDDSLQDISWGLLAGLMVENCSMLNLGYSCLSSNVQYSVLAEIIRVAAEK